MPSGPLFAGLVFDEDDQLVETTFIGSEPCYVVDDDGFKRHIPSADVDCQVLSLLQDGSKATRRSSANRQQKCPARTISSPGQFSWNN